MADKTKIEWAESTWNPVVGCSKVSPACDHCYAERMAARFHEKYGDVVTDKHGKWTGKILVRNQVIEQPRHWKKPRRIFVCSMSDFYHPAVPREIQCYVMGVILDCPQHDFLILTKRPGLAREFHQWVTLPANAWLGVTCENQKHANGRIPILLSIQAKIHFVSIEPMLGPVDLSEWLSHKGVPRRDGLDWVICGGESGPGARAMHPSWPRELRDQCIEAGTPFLFKQWGEWAPVQSFSVGSTTEDIGQMVKVGKHAAGRKLDGWFWDEYPTR